VIALVCSAVTLLGVVYLGAQLFDSSPPPSQPQAKGIVWAGRTFVDLAEFGRWLRSQGVAYEVWALRHPTRAGIAPLRPTTIPQAERAQPSGAGNRSTWTTVAGVAIVLAAFSLLVGIRRRSWVPRMGAAAAAGGRTLLRLAAVAGRASSTQARAGAWGAWRRRETLAWSIAAMLLATISALAVTLWI
jgi:hypothetical protein